MIVVKPTMPTIKERLAELGAKITGEIGGDGKRVDGEECCAQYRIRYMTPEGILLQSTYDKLNSVKGDLYTAQFELREAQRKVVGIERQLEAAELAVKLAENVESPY